mgnify:CR=1 FL=1
MKNRAGRIGMSQGGNKLVAGLIASLIALTVLLVVVLFIVNRDSQNDQQYIANAAELRVLSQEIAKNATEAAGGTAEAFNQLRRSRDEFQQLWANVTEGNPETGLPPSELAGESGVQQHWNSVRENADSILSTQDAVLGLHEVARTLNETIPQLQVEYDDIVQILLDNGAPAEQIALAQRQSLLAERIVRSVNNVLSGDEDAVIAADRFGRDASLFGRVLEGQLNGNQAMGISKVNDEDAIYGLEAVDELFAFFTGAIADSINYAIDQMRGLVQAIRGTAVRVASAAQETQSTAMHLADASEHQAQEIAGASAAVNEMAVSIDQVSSNAAESSAVAERSVAIAKKGAEVVQNTIRGMDNIREQIQETSKRIKRLGESSQEIGDIVSLINDIADQTNILSLNAAIQASMAGDAGRGFAVVADEVQRLAERSSAATKQIEALVKTIQSDTNEAVISMEHTTAEVVRGARLAQDAGIALEEIENVSMSLAELIQNISNAARQQSSSAAHISNTMNVIQEITSQTSSGTNATAKSIGNLAEMASELRSSVAGFTLPEEDMVDQEEEEDSNVPVVG